MLILLGVAALIGASLLTAIIALEAVRPPRRAAGYALARGLPIDPAEMSYRFSSWTLRCQDGVELPIWDIDLSNHREAEQPPLESPLTLILLHGWGRSRVESLVRLRHLGYAAPGAFNRALLVDLRGHGESTASLSRLGTDEERDLLELLRLAGAPRVVLAGHSMGGVTAIIAAASDDPAARSVVGVIAWAPYRNVHVPMRSRLRARDFPARPFTDLALAALRLIGVRLRDTEAFAARLRVPLLVIQGDADPISPTAGAERIARAAPLGQFVLLKGVTHGDAHEKAAAEDAAAVKSFVMPIALSES